MSDRLSIHRKRLAPVLMRLALAAVLAPFVRAQTTPPPLSELKSLSLDELTHLEISSVTRTAEPWWTTPGAVSIVTNEEIRRAGVNTLPDALRLAAGVHVAQSSARTWAVGIRGFNVISGNKVSVFIDGRSLYTPFFSGVQWNAQDVMLEDVDRIEVARGPVGALWGAYAVNGTIQIVTKPAWETQGWLASAGGGTEDPGFFNFRYGARAGQTFYRIYAKYWQTDWTYDASGRPTQTATDFFQGGVRTDTLTTHGDVLTVQGDAYTNKGLPLDHLQEEVSGGNVLGRWRRVLSSGDDVSLTSYAEYRHQFIPPTFEEQRHTLSLSGQWHHAMATQDWLLGFDAWRSGDEITSLGSVTGLDPSRRTLSNVGLFAQDTIALGSRWKGTLGLKLERNNLTSVEWAPTGRLAYTPNTRTTLWAAASRAVRPPVRIDVDLFTRFNGVSFFEANEDYDSERVWAFEAGWRHQPTESFTFDASVFHNDYSNLRSFEPAGADPLPLTFKNTLTARSTGTELAVMWQALPQLLLKGNYRYLDLAFDRTPESRDTGNAVSEGNDPKHLLSLSAHLTLPHGLEGDVYFRHVSALPNPVTEAYSAADIRLGWRPSARWEISLVARDLLSRQHRELITTNSLNEWVHRRLIAKITWRY